MEKGKMEKRRFEPSVTRKDIADLKGEGIINYCQNLIRIASPRGDQKTIDAALSSISAVYKIATKDFGGMYVVCAMHDHTPDRTPRDCNLTCENLYTIKGLAYENQFGSISVATWTLHS